MTLTAHHSMIVLIPSRPSKVKINAPVFMENLSAACAEKMFSGFTSRFERERMIRQNDSNGTALRIPYYLALFVGLNTKYLSQDAQNKVEVNDILQMKNCATH